MIKGIKILQNDPVMKKLIAKYKLEPLPKPDLSPQYIFNDIVETILGQQLSNKAADVIIDRFRKLFKRPLPTPAQVLDTPDQKIRDCGTSWQKVKYIKNVASAVSKNRIILENLKGASDDEIKKELVGIKGIGPWTAEMLLMFTFRREDIFSEGDLGIQNAMQKHYGVKKGDTKRMQEIAKAWQPYRTTACRILWKSLD